MTYTRTLLFKTNIGSHAWRMEHEGSDLDTFSFVLADTEDVLSGTADLGSRFIPGSGAGSEKVDEHVFELQKAVPFIVSNNFNIIVASYAPMIFDLGYLDRWRTLTTACLSKNIYKSTNGLAVHNRRLAEKEEGYSRLKKLRTICRSLKFGISILEGRGPVFEPVWEAGFDTVDLLTAHLNAAKDASALPDKCPAEAEAQLRRYVRNLRLMDFCGML